MPDKKMDVGALTAADDVLFRERTWKDTTFFVVLKQFSRNKMALVGLIIILVLALVGIFAPLLAPYNYASISPMNANKPPNAEHWFGTDLYGRDILSRIIYGARYSLMIGLSASLLGTLTGVILGLISGYFAGMVESLILRFCDVIQSIPNMLLCIVVSQALGRGLFPTVVALSFYSLPTTTRLLRSVILSQREQEYIEAARVINCSHLRILVSHLLPNCMSPIIVGFSGTIGHKILSSAGLSFLGLGIQEPIAEWGAMLSAGRSQLRYAPHAVFFPGIFVALVVLSFNLIGDCLRDSLDPKLRQ